MPKNCFIILIKLRKRKTINLGNIISGIPKMAAMLNMEIV
jgi:hypothetical protein